jgi:hypothetical protein
VIGRIAKIAGVHRVVLSIVCCGLWDESLKLDL